MKKGPDTPKGFRDIKPDEAKKRREVINKICTTLEQYDFLPIETPTIEFATTLKGKYGEEEKLIYEFKDRGDRDLALRYDLTVPLARYIANNLGVLNPSFARYQVGQVYRGEKPQAGRYREFTQLDFDIVGSTNPEDDAKVIAAAIDSVKKTGLKKAKMAINDRKNFSQLSSDFVRTLDKIYKIGKEGVKNELKEKNFPEAEIKLVDEIQNLKPTPSLAEIFKILTKKHLFFEGVDFYYDPYLARGLDYYTDTIYELKPGGEPKELSIGGGGRYNNLIGIFAGRDIPAVGFSFGIDRLVELI